MSTTDEFDYRDVLLRLLEKISRQRGFWSGKARDWRRHIDDPDSDDSPEVLEAKAFVIDHCGRDLSFILDKAMLRLPTEDKCEVIRLADEARRRIDDRRSAA